MVAGCKDHALIRGSSRLSSNVRLIGTVSALLRCDFMKGTVRFFLAIIGVASAIGLSSASSARLMVTLGSGFQWRLLASPLSIATDDLEAARIVIGLSAAEFASTPVAKLRPYEALADIAAIRYVRPFTTNNVSAFTSTRQPKTFLSKFSPRQRQLHECFRRLRNSVGAQRHGCPRCANFSDPGAGVQLFEAIRA